MSFELFISKRYTRTKQKQAFISLITILSIAGVTVGVMALIVVIAVMSGAEDELKNKILGIASHVSIMRYGGSFSNYKNISEQIKKNKEIEAITPFVYTQAMLKSSTNASGALLRGIDPKTAGNVIKMLAGIEFEKLISKTKEIINDIDIAVPGIILGKELSNNLDLRENDILYVISPQGMISPIGHVPSMKRFKVVGIFKSGLYEYDGSIAYINIKEAQNMLRIGDSITGLDVRVHDIYKAKETADLIISKLSFPYWANNWMQTNHNLFSALKLEKTVMFVILTLIVLVAAFNIASTLIMMVMEKTKDIAILKTMGATNKSIQKIFVLKGLVIGLIGTLLGIIFGFTLCLLLKRYQFIDLPGDVYYFSKLPVKLEILDVVVIAFSAIIICFIATLYPANKASKLNPVEAIRYG